MAIRRVVALAVAVALSGTFALAQSAKPDTKKRSKQEQQEIEQIVKLVDGVMAGQPGTCRHPDVDHPVLPEVAGAAHLRAVRAGREGRPGRRRGHVHPGGQSVRPARPEGQEGRVPVGRHPLRAGRAAHQGQAPPRVHGGARHLRRLPGHEGAPARKGAQDPGRQDGRRQAADRGARLPERRVQHQLAAGDRQGEHAHRTGRPR